MTTKYIETQIEQMKASEMVYLMKIAGLQFKINSSLARNWPTLLRIIINSAKYN